MTEMIKAKTNDLSGPALDWAVAKCEGLEMEGYYGPLEGGWDLADYPYSTDWALAGPIIEREKINFREEYPGLYFGFIYNGVVHKQMSSASTPLVAAMRCFVASKLGNELEIPVELITASNTPSSRGRKP